MAGCRGVSAQPGSPDPRGADQQPDGVPDVEAEFEDESDDEAAAREEAAVREQEQQQQEPQQEQQQEQTRQAPATGAFDVFAPVPQEPSPELVELAKAYGVLTEYHDWQGRHTRVSRRTIVAVLRALDVDASTEESVGQALLTLRARRWRRILPDVVVVREGDSPGVPVHVPDGLPVQVWVDLEDGGRRVLEQEDQ